MHLGSEALDHNGARRARKARHKARTVKEVLSQVISVALN